MSYDLLFWRQPPDEDRSSETIAESLCDGVPIVNLEILLVEQIIARVNDQFPLTTDGGLTFWDGEEDGMFEIYNSEQHIHFCCRRLLHKHVNTLIDIMHEFRCPLYDPQINRRFDSAQE